MECYLEIAIHNPLFQIRQFWQPPKQPCQGLFTPKKVFVDFKPIQYYTCETQEMPTVNWFLVCQYSCNATKPHRRQLLSEPASGSQGSSHNFHALHPFFNGSQVGLVPEQSFSSGCWIWSIGSRYGSTLINGQPQSPHHLSSLPTDTHCFTYLIYGATVMLELLQIWQCAGINISPKKAGEMACFLIWMYDSLICLRPEDPSEFETIYPRRNCKIKWLQTWLQTSETVIQSKENKLREGKKGGQDTKERERWAVRQQRGGREWKEGYVIGGLGMTGGWWWGRRGLACTHWAW